MGMPQMEPRWTAELVRALPEDGQRHELVSGVLVMTPAPAPLHQLLVQAIFLRLDRHMRTTGVGTAMLSPADLSLGEDEILQPDLFVYPRAVTPKLRRWTDISILYLAVEVLSPSTARYDRTLKRKRYQRAGVPEYWIVDPDARVIERWRPEDERPEVLSEGMTWQPAEGVEPLVLDLPALFREGWEEEAAGTD